MLTFNPPLILIHSDNPSTITSPTPMCTQHSPLYSHDCLLTAMHSCLPPLLHTLACHPCLPLLLATLASHPCLPPFFASLVCHPCFTPLLATLASHPCLPPLLATLASHPRFTLLLATLAYAYLYTYVSTVGTRSGAFASRTLARARCRCQEGRFQGHRIFA